MTYYRRKILLALIETFENKVSTTYLQKLLFLFTRKQKGKSYDFVPYRYGCYSFQANQDLFTLTTLGYLSRYKEGNKEIWSLAKDELYSGLLTEEDRAILLAIKREFKGMPLVSLIRHTYIKYPYWASKSNIAEKILTQDELQNIRKQIKQYHEKTLFTIGYEGLSLEQYINKLILSDVALLCDVRKNAFSQKYGFSKSQLQNACEAVGIKYFHLPQFGIESEKRHELNNMEDYRLLFNEYEKSTLNFTLIQEILILLNKYNRIALTCFEKDVKMCHRGRIVKYIESIKNFETPIRHL